MMITATAITALDVAETLERMKHEGDPTGEHSMGMTQDEVLEWWYRLPSETQLTLPL
jgi:hypothetical protein